MTRTLSNIFFILVFALGLISCNPFNNKLNREYANLFISRLNDFDSLLTLSYNDKAISINNYYTSTDQIYIHQEDSIGLTKIYRTDSIIQKLNFNKVKFYELLELFKKTNAHNFDRNDSIYYFICNSFLDDSNGMIYSKTKLKIWKQNDRIILNEHYIDNWNIYKDNW